ncbi:MAG: VOC family protein [Paracoccaceae bacterium]
MDDFAIDFIEMGSEDMPATQAFLAGAFGWGFVEYGAHYRDVTGAGVSGGLHDEGGPPLIVLKARDLRAARDRVTALGAQVTKDIFAFPGGRRFEFTAPGGLRLAVWCEGDAG